MALGLRDPAVTGLGAALCRSCAVTHARSTARCSACKFRNSCAEQFWEMAQFRNTSAVVRFFFFSAPLPPLHPFFSHSVLVVCFFFFFHFPLPMNETTLRMSLQTHPDLVWCRGRTGKAKGPGSSASLGTTWQPAPGPAEGEVTRTGVQRGCSGFTPGGSTFLCSSHSACSWNCEP